MGNTASVETSRKGSKAAQKLSKRLTGNLTTLDLVDSNGLSDITYQQSAAARRRFSLPFIPTSAPSQRHFATENTLANDLVASNETSALKEYLSNAIFQYSHPQGPDEPCELKDCSSQPVFQNASSHADGSRRRSRSAGVVASTSRGRRIHKTKPGYIGADEDRVPSRMGLTTNNSPPRNRSRSSSNYDYEAGQILALVSDPAFEDHSAGGDGQFQTSLSREQSYTASYPAQTDAAELIPHTESDLSLYAPIRRRSLMTPGVATRPAPADPSKSPSTQLRNSPRPTPAHRDYPKPGGMKLLSIPRSPAPAGPIPRAHTPCETDYKQTGAFKHGTLRITNGSPTASSAWESDDGLRSNGSSTSTRKNSYTDAGDQATGKRQALSDDNRYLKPPSFVSASPNPSTRNSIVGTNGQKPTKYLLPELELATAPLSMGPMTGIEPELPKLQASGNLADIGAHLFQGESFEYDPDFFNLGIGRRAKSRSRSRGSLGERQGKGTDFLNVCPGHRPRSRSRSPGSSEEEKRKETIERSDSGVVVTPTSEVPQKLLSKADSGYSSSVSIRTLSSKRGRGQETENPHKHEETASHAQKSLGGKLSGNTLMAGSAIVSLKEDLQESSTDKQPPAVPKIDDHNRLQKKQVSTPSINSQALTGKVEPLLERAPGAGNVSETPGSSRHMAPTRNNPTPASTSGAGKARKRSLLKRLLSGSRIPMTSNGIIDQGDEVDAFSVPQEIQATELPSSFDTSATRRGIRVENTEPLAAIMLAPAITHTSTDQTSQDSSIASTTSQDQMHRPRSSLRNSITSTVTRAASSVMTNNTSRKLMPAEAKSDQNRISPELVVPGEPSRHSHETSQRRRDGIGSKRSISFIPEDGKKHDAGQIRNRARSNSMTSSASVRSRNPRVYDDALRSHLARQDEQHRIAYQKAYKSHHSVSKTPPPVSMRTRNKGHVGQFRASPSIRPHSNPRSGRPEPPHQRSREDVPSHPYHYPIDVNNIALSRTSNMDSVYANHATHIQAFSNGAPQMLPLDDQTHLVDYQIPGGHLQAGAVHSREPSYDHSRHNSLGSQTSQRSMAGSRQFWPQSGGHDHPTLRHRSSYDGYQFQTRQNYGQENVPYESLSTANGQVYAPDPLGLRPTSQQSRQYQHRGHPQHYSLDQYGSPVPYRVLHSYGTPAYRGMQNWQS